MLEETERERVCVCVCERERERETWAGVERRERDQERGRGREVVREMGRAGGGEGYRVGSDGVVTSPELKSSVVSKVVYECSAAPALLLGLLGALLV